MWAEVRRSAVERLTVPQMTGLVFVLVVVVVR